MQAGAVSHRLVAPTARADSVRAAWPDARVIAFQAVGILSKESGWSRLVWFNAGLGLAAMVACTEGPHGGVMLAVTTDMAVPANIDALQIIVQQSGRTKFSSEFPLDGASAYQLPATLEILPSPSDTSPADVRVIGLHQGAARVLRELLITIPTSAPVLARVDLQYVCAGMVSGSSPGDWASTCPSGQTCLAGACADANVDSSKLSGFDPTEVFGGATGPGSGACFDTVNCFTDAIPAFVSQNADAGCTLMVASPTATDGTPSAGPGVAVSASPNLNVALLLPPGSDGACNASGCLIPLDQEPTVGWSAASGGVTLPASLCQKIASGGGVKLVTSTSCASKVPSVPVCASSGSSDTPPQDGGPSVDASPCGQVDIAAGCSQVVASAAASPAASQCMGASPATYQKICSSAASQPPDCQCAFEGFLRCASTTQWTCAALAGGQTELFPTGCDGPLQMAAAACPGLPIPTDPGTPPPMDAGTDSGMPTCAATEMDCNGVCTNPRVDAQNCGFCGNVCPANAVCRAGGCAPSCTPKTCADAGYQCGSAPDGCGGLLSCGTCPTGQTCGMFGPNTCGPNLCGPGMMFCGGACINPMTDSQNCGACGLRCGGGTGVLYFCSNGICKAG
jgi:hypothetical protein